MAVYFESAECSTVLGDTRATVESLVNGVCGLRMTPVLGPDGGEEVPLALVSPMSTPVPPRWWEHLLNLLAAVPEADWGSSRLPVLISSSNFGIDSLYAFGRDRQAPGHIDWAPGGAVARHLQIEMGWSNNMTLFSHACVSAHLAIQQARNLLEQDLADKVLLVSFDYIGPFVTGGFHALKILNSGMPAPYGDRETGSIGLGDGAAWAVLSKKPGAWKIQGAETWNEMYHFTANDPSGDGFRAVVQPMLSQLQQRKLWVKGHGTGTLDTGKMESGVIQELFPASPLVSWKGSLGHTLGSCALVEAILAMRAHISGTIPGTVGTERPTFTDLVATTPFAAKDFDSILLLANAFGGAHAALWLSHD